MTLDKLEKQHLKEYHELKSFYEERIKSIDSLIKELEKKQNA